MTNRLCRFVQETGYAGLRPGFTFPLLCAILVSMIFPIRELIEYKKNMYEITVAASQRSFQLSMLLDDETKEDYDGKMVALAARQVFTEEVEFRLEAN